MAQQAGASSDALGGKSEVIADAAKHPSESPSRSSSANLNDAPSTHITRHQSTKDVADNASAGTGAPAMSNIADLKDPEQIEMAAPSESHALAAAAIEATDAETDHPETGAAQQNDLQTETAAVKDLGWNEPVEVIPAPLVANMSNEELWMLVRRFNKQMYHVKAIPSAPKGGLDLNIADEEEFSPDKLRSVVERLYMTVGIGLISFGKHIARLRSWKERNRTAAFCTVYFLAWVLDLLMPTFLAMIITLIVYPPARARFFPPAPIALVDSSTGGVQKPPAGVLASHDTLTGAPEAHQGEAVEQEAANFFNSLGTIAVSAAAGKSNNTVQDDEPLEDDQVQGTPLTTGIMDARATSTGSPQSRKHDKTKQPMEQIMWTKIRPATHGLAMVADTWERISNALQPTPPFPKRRARIKLACVLMPALAASLYVTSYMLLKSLTFGIGFGFFGDPLFQKSYEFINAKIPNWQHYLKYIQPQNSLLRGVPTNAQLTITLLRIGEANKAPLPPPPRAKGNPPDKAKLPNEDIQVGATESEIAAAAAPDPEKIAVRDSGATSAVEKQKKQHGSRLLSFIRGTSRLSVETALTADHLRARFGSSNAKRRLDVIPDKKRVVLAGPVEFKARYKGRKGHVYIGMSNEIPFVGFTAEDVKNTSKDLKPEFTVSVPNITEVKKIEGLGWKSKLVVGWAMESEVLGGLEIVGRDGGRFTVTAVELREELFNRLISMGGQNWEAW